MPNPLSLLRRAYRQATERPLAYNWFWFTRRVGQKYVDPRFLSRLWKQLQTDSGFRSKLAQDMDASDQGIAALTHALTQRAAQTFFFSHEDRATFQSRYASLFPEPSERALQEASSLLKNQFHYAGRLIDSEDPPRWYSAREVEGMNKWHRIPAAFHWLKTLGKAYWLTGDHAYEQKAKRWLSDWLQAEPLFDHDLWESVNFVGMRALNLLTGFLFFAEAWQSDLALQRKIWEQLYLHARQLERRMEYWSYNHLLWNARDLAILGLVLEPFFQEARRWKTHGLSVVNAEMAKQFQADGINIELSIHYQVFVTKLIGEMLGLFQKAGEPLPSDAHERFCLAVSALQDLQRPDGLLPLFGDGYRSYDPNAEGTIDELVPFIQQLGSRLSYPKPIERPKSLPGVSVLKTQRGERSLYALMMTGQSLYGKVHAHADSLSIELADEQGPILIDPGAYGEDSSAWRAYIRSSQAHNTVCVDGHGMSQVSGVYGMMSALKAELTGYESAPDESDVVWMTARHYNFLKLPCQAQHQRLLAMGGTELFVIIDYLEGTQPFRVERFFQFSDASLKALSDHQWQWNHQGRSWHLQTLSVTPLQEQAAAGQENPLRGWSGEHRGAPRQISTIVQMSEGRQHYLMMSMFYREGVSIEPALTRPSSGIAVLGGRLLIQKTGDVWRIQFGRADSVV